MRVTPASPALVARLSDALDALPKALPWPPASLHDLHRAVTTGQTRPGITRLNVDTDPFFDSPYRIGDTGINGPIFGDDDGNIYYLDADKPPPPPPPEIPQGFVPYNSTEHGMHTIDFEQIAAAMRDSGLDDYTAEQAQVAEPGQALWEVGPDDIFVPVFGDFHTIGDEVETLYSVLDRPTPDITAAHVAGARAQGSDDFTVAVIRDRELVALLWMGHVVDLVADLEPASRANLTRALDL